MSRCDYDGVFYRVFCVTLLAIAFAFTIILTNVFVDIDGLLANKKTETLYSNHATQNDLDAIFLPDSKSEPYYHEDKSYDDTEYGYRTKRSLESQNFIFRIKSPKMKNILKNRLATLLEDLDEEESEHVVKNERNDKFDTFDINDHGNSVDNNNDRKVVKRTDIYKHDNIEFTQNDNMMNTAIHNSILQGIGGHVDVHELYKKVHALTSSNIDNLEPRVGAPKPNNDEAKQLFEPTEKIKPSESTKENNLIDELVKYKKLHKPEDGAEKKMKGPELLIQTVIDIKSQTDDKNKKGNTNSTNSNENIKGIIKLIYNGKSIKFSQMDDEVTIVPTDKVTTVKPQTTRDLTTEKVKSRIEETDTLDSKYSHLPKAFLNKILNDYFANNNKDLLAPENLKVEAKRLKRHIKIRYETDDKSKHQKHSNKTNTDDDELFVEIETHFDSKGMKGDKKKKLIKNLIEKIQKAIHEPTVTKKKSKDHKAVHVKKRTQNPLDHKEQLDKVSVRQSVKHRHLDPISKIANERDPITAIYDKTGESWKKKFSGPGFLTHTKGLNSAEMGEVDVEYAKTVNTANSEIPQRYQKPLNPETNDDNTNNFYDLGNLKFFLKDIDGTGFSIGINKFVDEPPDSESIKLFTGLENIIQTYHQKYDPNDPIEVNPYPERMSVNEYSNYNSSHVVVRRSVSENDYHSNAYKLIYDKDFLAYKNYEDIFKDEKKSDRTGDLKHTIGETVFKRTNLPSFIVDKNFLSKNLKPAEIFGLANLLDRKKRTITVKKISNLSKIKMNTFINTKPMVTKRLHKKNYFNRRRNKRQIDKIRIIASEIPSSYKHLEEAFISDIPQHKHSEEVFVVSDEHVFADRAIVREVPSPEGRYSEKEVDHNDKIEQHYDLITPYVYEDQNQPYTYMTNIFDNKARHNALMSKYPHIFMEEISRSKEEDIPQIPLINLISRRHSNINQNQEPTPSNNSAIEDQEMPPLDEIVNAISPDPHPKANYKVTVKILPKNSTDVNGGFKEVHTSINKSFNKNGLLYSSLVNVSEISKITKMNKTILNTAPTTTTVSPLVKKLKQDQDRVQEILKKHRERIKEQLLHLNKEKEKLETMIRNKTQIDTNQSEDDFVDLVLSSDPPKVIRLRKKEVNKLAASAFLKAQDSTPSIVTITSNSTTSPITTTSTTTTPHPVTITSIASTKMTTQKPKPTTAAIKENEKLSIMNNIQKNGNLTYEILQKIDKNTQILQQFLQKISELQPTTPATRRNLKVPDPKLAINDPTDWKKFQPSHEPFFTETMANLEVHKNDTQVSIPFIYAYQQKFHLPDKLKTPVASVVYHGHIHTNVNKDEYWKGHANVNEIDKPKAEGPMKDNRSRFFMDGPESDFKVIPVGATKNDKSLTANDVATKNTTIH